MTDEDHEAFGAMVHRGKVEARPEPLRLTRRARVVFHDAVAEELGVPPGTEALWEAIDKALARMAEQGIFLIEGNR